MHISIEDKTKDKIINDFNAELYKHFNITVADANYYIGYYNGYIYQLIDRVYKKHGPIGLRSEFRYIIQYLDFLFTKLENNSFFTLYVLISYYFRLYYRHYSQRKVYQVNQLSFVF